MAFSFGAAAGGAADTLEKILAERRADALVRQKQAEDAADREFRNRQLAQQLQIAQMENQRQMASNAGAALAKIRTDREKGLEEAVKAFAGMTPADQGLITPGGLELERQAQEVEAMGGSVPSLAGVQRIDVPALVGPEPEQGGYLPGTLQAQLADMAPTQRPVGRFFQRVPTAEETETAQAAGVLAGIDMARTPAERLQQIGEAKKRVAGLSPRVATQMRSTLNALEETIGREMRDERQTAALERQNKNRGSLSATSEANLIVKLAKDWDTAITPMVELNRQVSLMNAGLAAARRGDLAQGAQAVLVTFQKILDPPSVVRESEYMRSAAGLALKDRIEGYIERLRKGGAGVPMDELEKFARLAQEAAAAQKSGYLDNRKKRLTMQADKYGIPPELIFGEDSQMGDADATASTTRRRVGANPYAESK